MNRSFILKNIGVAFLAQGVSMLISCLTSLIVPKILGVEEFAYWQLFLFYSSYVGFFHFGLNDGVYLIHGGKTRDQIDKPLVNSQFLIGTVFQIVFAVVFILASSAYSTSTERHFVLICTATYMVIKNAANFLGFTFQAMNETKLFSFSTIIERVFFFFPLIFLIALRCREFEVFVVAYCISGVLQLLFCLFHARDFLRSGFILPRPAFQQCARSIKVGIKLMFANIASMLVLGVARFVIDCVWGIETFGKLSLSLSMVNFVLAFVSQGAMVLFPALRQASPDELKRFFYASRNTFALIMPIAYLFYFPGVWLLRMWLPDYADSFIFIAYLLPICVFDAKMDISCTTCFKVGRDEALLLKMNALACIISVAGTLVGAFVLKSIWAIIAFVVIAIVLRNIISESVLTKKLQVAPCLRLMLGELVLTLAFLCIASVVKSIALGCCAYFVAYAIFLVVNKSQCKQIFSVFKRIRERRKRN